ncbi:hypothetical protein HC931_25610 [Candidatus Gracilibacteria bacterium]|nr:hypothetical protein [Candidatus Gracilibacteria bacterium]NJM90004.1 hypothetical protein [Hydrococcus sp. RU_2_2]NJP21905.1 hypothetical protein [Hydrococcus sp. CRU_1_1]
MKFLIQKNGLVKTNLSAEEFNANCEYGGWCPYLASVLVVKDGFLYERIYEFDERLEEEKEPPFVDFELKISKPELHKALSQTLKDEAFLKTTIVSA